MIFKTKSSFNIFVVIIILIFVFLVISQERSRNYRYIKQAVKNQLAELKSRNYEAAYSYTSKSYQQLSSLQNFKNFVDKYPIFKTHIESYDDSAEIKGDKGTVNETLVGNDGSRTHVIYNLDKESRQWKISWIHMQLE